MIIYFIYIYIYIYIYIFNYIQKHKVIHLLEKINIDLASELYKIYKLYKIFIQNASRCDNFSKKSSNY